MTGYDVFLCYVWEHKSLANDLFEALEDAGVRVFQDDKEVKDFHYLGAAIDEALRSSRTLLALYTPGFWASEYCRYELHFALRHSYALHRSRARVMAAVQGMDIGDVRPGVLKNWKIPPRDGPLDELAAAVAGYVGELAAADDRRLGDAPDPPAPTWFPARPPRHHSDFQGREQELWAVHDMLFADDDPAAGGQVVAVTGPAGIGKTMFAEQYARLFALDSPGGVFMLTGFGSQSPTGGRSAQVRQRRDELVAQFTNGAPDPEAVLAGREPYLWIVDDVPVDVDRVTFDSVLAPTPNGRTLLTSRASLGAWVPHDRQVELAALAEDAALSVLVSRWQPPGAPADLGAERRLQALKADARAWSPARDLVTVLAGHPLALTLAAGLVGQPDFAGFGALGRRVTSHDRNVVMLAQELQPDLHLPTDRAASILSTIGYSLDMLPRPRDSLRLASLGAQAPVPAALFASTLAEADGVPAAEAEREAAAQLGLAKSRFLALPADVGGVEAWEVHPLVSRVMRLVDDDEGRRQRLRDAAVAVLTTLLDAGFGRSSPTTLAAYLPHVHEIASSLSDPDHLHLLAQSGTVSIELGSTAAARDLYQGLYDTCRAVLGDEHRTTLVMLVALGVAAGLDGDHRRARVLKERVVRSLTAAVGADHPDTLVARNNLAVTYDDLGDHERARSVYTDVHALRQQQLGENHPDTLEALMNLAIAIGRCGNHDEALELKRDVHRRMRVVHGDAHPRVLDAANIVAASLARTDRAAAHDLFLEQAEQRRHVSGESTDLAFALENAAATAPDWPTATALMETSYRTRLVANGPAHPLSQRALRDLLIGFLQTHDPARTSAAPRIIEPVPTPLPEGDGDSDQVGGEEGEEDADDEAVRVFEWAGRWHDQAHALWSADAPETLTSLCLLAHALALLDQFDDHVEQAWDLVRDAAEALALELGEDDPAAQAAAHLRAWIGGLVADREG